jgi:hypothetical protein
MRILKYTLLVIKNREGAFLLVTTGYGGIGVQTYLLLLVLFFQVMLPTESMFNC